MRKLFGGLLFLVCALGWSQEPKGMAYQGTVIEPVVEIPGVDSTVTPFSEKAVCFRFTIYDDTQTIEYTETHNTTTDYFGQVNLVIGRGDNPSDPLRLESLRWDGTAKYLEVEVDYTANCSNFEVVSPDFPENELHYVPFAFYALGAASNVIEVNATAPIVVSGLGTLADPLLIGFDGGLDDLNDVDLTTTPPTTNQTLVFDGTQWVPGNKALQLVATHTAVDGQTDFATPAAIADINNIDVYRNGVLVDFLQINTNTIQLDGISCYLDDQIKIIQLQ